MNSNGWHKEWVCTLRDLDRLEWNDLQAMVEEGSAWLVKDSRRSFGKLLVETLTDQVVESAVYLREYMVFLEPGLWWIVPSVRVRLIYDRRGRGKGKVYMSRADFDSLYETYFPATSRHQPAIVEGYDDVPLERVRS